MWIVRLALRAPYTFVVMAVLMLVLGVTAIITMPTDIFPYINIPVVTVVWTYTGLSPDEMEKRVVTVCERAMTTTVNDIEHMESTSYNGVSVIRIYFQPNAKVELALSQVTSIVQTILRVLPPGIFPPIILKYDASSVPILQLALESETLSEQQLVRSWSELHPNAARDRAGRFPPASFRRKAAPDHGGSRSERALCKGAFRHRCVERSEPAKPDSSGRRRQDRRSRLLRPVEQQPSALCPR